MILRQVLWAAILMLVCVGIEILTLAFLVRSIIKIRTWREGSAHPIRIARLLAPMFLILMLSHVLQVIVWGIFYRFSESFETIEQAVYFSIVSYTTLGYGDLILGEHWRILGGLEAITGMLLLGWSTAFTFLVLNRLWEATAKREGAR